MNEHDLWLICAVRKPVAIDDDVPVLLASETAVKLHIQAIVVFFIVVFPFDYEYHCIHLSQRLDKLLNRFYLQGNVRTNTETVIPFLK